MLLEFQKKKLVYARFSHQTLQMKFFVMGCVHYLQSIKNFYMGQGSKELVWMAPVSKFGWMAGQEITDIQDQLQRWYHYVLNKTHCNNNNNNLPLFFLYIFFILHA